MDPDDPDILLPEERGQRAGYEIVPATPQRPSAVAGMSREQIIEAVNKKRHGNDLN